MQLINVYGKDAALAQDVEPYVVIL